MKQEEPDSDDELDAFQSGQVARGYQQKIFEVAKTQNTIAILDTGTGKVKVQSYID